MQSPQPTPVPAPRPRAVPPIGNQPFSKAADRILLELAPSHPGGQAFGNATTSTVSIEQIKEGTYSDKKATFVLLAVQLANEEIERFHFNIHLTNAPSLIPSTCTPFQPGLYLFRLTSIRLFGPSGFEVPFLT